MTSQTCDRLVTDLEPCRNQNTTHYTVTEAADLTRVYIADAILDTQNQVRSKLILLNEVSDCTTIGKALSYGIL